LDWRKLPDSPLCGETLATGGVTGGWVGGDCDSGGGCGSGGFGELSAATTARGVGSAGFPDEDGFSDTAACVSPTEVDGFSAADSGDFSGGGLRKASTKAHPPATQTAITKTTPAVMTPFCRGVRRGAEEVLPCRSAASLSDSARPLAAGDPSPLIGSEMLGSPQIGERGIRSGGFVVITMTLKLPPFYSTFPSCGGAPDRRLDNGGGEMGWLSPSAARQRPYEQQLQPEGDFSLQIRCRCSEGQSYAQSLIVACRQQGRFSRPCDSPPLSPGVRGCRRHHGRGPAAPK
jgi:hypothetical protein